MFNTMILLDLATKFFFFFFTFRGLIQLSVKIVVIECKAFINSTKTTRQ